MALGASTFSAAGGAVGDLFAGLGALDQARLKAKGLGIQASGVRLTAEGTRIGAEGTRIGAQGTRLTAQGLRLKAEGDIAEADNYDLAASYARENERFTQASTDIQASQLTRNVTMAIGGQRAATAGAGLAQSGSALDLLASSASQGSLARSVLTTQGQITEAGYDEQAKSYETMSAAGRATAAGERSIADQTDVLAARTDALADRSDQIAAGQDQIAMQTDLLAQDTLSAGKQASTGSFISAAIKGITAVASVALAPETGGLSLAALGTLASTSPGEDI